MKTQKLNRQQRHAVEHGITGQGGNVAGPLRIIAGAGTGKTQTLAHRVANLIAKGADPNRIMMLTFTRQAASEMQARVRRILASTENRSGAVRLLWAGTFHAIGLRILRQHGRSLGLKRDFSIADREDAADLMKLVANETKWQKLKAAGLTANNLLDIYSRAVNADMKLGQVLRKVYPRWLMLEKDLGQVFTAYAEAKLEQGVLDYDDLLLHWDTLLRNEEIARAIGGRFDHVLVDEYQDTNALQAAILCRIKPTGAGVTVVGDDAQAIYGFRAAEVRNILDFNKRFQLPTTTVELELNYRSTGPILAAANAVINESAENLPKALKATREGGRKPRLVTVSDEQMQATFVADEIGDFHERGHDLKKVAVLYRSAHHSIWLQTESPSKRNLSLWNHL